MKPMTPNNWSEKLTLSEHDKDILCVDRTSLMAWSAGTLLKRDAAGRCIVGDNVDNERAEELMLAGHTIGLTENGKLVARMRLENNHFVETKEIK